MESSIPILMWVTRPGDGRHQIVARKTAIAVICDVKKGVFQMTPRTDYGIGEGKCVWTNLYDAIKYLGVSNIQAIKERCLKDDVVSIESFPYLSIIKKTRLTS